MRRHQPSLCPWSHSAALCLGGSGAQLLVKLHPVCQTLGSEESGIPAFGLVNFGQELLFKFPSLGHHIPTALPARQEPPAFPASSLQGVKAPGVKQREARLRPKCRCPGRALSCRAHGEPGMERVTHLTLSSQTKAAPTPAQLGCVPTQAGQAWP